MGSALVGQPNGSPTVVTADGTTSAIHQWADGAVTSDVFMHILKWGASWSLELSFLNIWQIGADDTWLKPWFGEWRDDMRWHAWQVPWCEWDGEPNRLEDVLFTGFETISQSVCMFMCNYIYIYAQPGAASQYVCSCACIILYIYNYNYIYIYIVYACVCASDIIYIHTGWRCLKEDGVKRYCLMFSQTYLLSFSAWSGRFMAPCYTQ